MAKSKDNAILSTEENTTEQNSITYANDVVATIAGIAANEVEGIAGMCSIGGSILGKNKNITKGVKVEIGTEETSVDLYVVVEYGTPIQKAASETQENVKKAIESMTGLHVVRVDVHVQSVSFEKENNALQSGFSGPALAPGKDENEKAGNIVINGEEESAVTEPEEAEENGTPCTDSMSDNAENDSKCVSDSKEDEKKSDE